MYLDFAFCSMPVYKRVGDLQGNDLSRRKTSEMTSAKIAAEIRQCSRDSNSVDHFRQMHIRYKGRPEAAQSSGILYQMPSSWLLGFLAVSSRLEKNWDRSTNIRIVVKVSTNNYIARVSIPELCVLFWFVC